MLFLYPMLTLMIDALNVIDMRLRLIAAGKSTPDEMFLMVNEKVDALEETRAIFMRGGDANQIIDNYRKIVAANAARLSAQSLALFRLFLRGLFHRPFFRGRSFDAHALEFLGGFLLFAGPFQGHELARVFVALLPCARAAQCRFGLRPLLHRALARIVKCR